jgi:hypothetical protein
MHAHQCSLLQSLRAQDDDVVIIRIIILYLVFINTVGDFSGHKTWLLHNWRNWRKRAIRGRSTAGVVVVVVGLDAVVLPTDDDVAGDQEGGTEPPQRGQGLGEDGQAEEGGDDEVGRRVHDGDLGCGVAPCQGRREESPHYAVEDQVEAEENLGRSR